MSFYDKKGYFFFLKVIFFLFLDGFLLLPAYCNIANKQLHGISLSSIVIDTPTFENQYVVVYKNNNVISKENDSEIKYKIIVALSNLKLSTGKKKFKLVRGELKVFSKEDSYKIFKGEFFEIGIKENHPIPETPSNWLEPEKNKTVFQNDDFRIFEERLGPKEERALHSHLQRLVVRLNNTHLTDPRFYPDGQEGKGIQVPNTVKFAEPVEHVVRNLSDVPVFNIVIEFKAKK